ncbi:MAG: hypothetical protein EOO88_52410 [Pedobacter sp.]|nr:MAG: hypothetical protein EOO88_52410 [Pedobacter sp.]
MYEIEHKYHYCKLVKNHRLVLNIAAVISATIDSAAMRKDASLIFKTTQWNKISWSNVHGQMGKLALTRGYNTICLFVK